MAWGQKMQGLETTDLPCPHLGTSGKSLSLMVLTCLLILRRETALQPALKMSERGPREPAQCFLTVPGKFGGNKDQGLYRTPFGCDIPPPPTRSPQSQS